MGKYIFAAVLILAIVVLVIVLIRSNLSKEEKDFALFVQGAARNSGIAKETLKGYIFQYFESLLLAYASQHGALVVNNAPRLRRYIYDTY